MRAKQRRVLLTFTNPGFHSRSSELRHKRPCGMNTDRFNARRAQTCPFVRLRPPLAAAAAAVCRRDRVLVKLLQDRCGHALQGRLRLSC